MQDFLYLKQLLDNGQGWLQVALLTGLFVAVVFRPERIRNEMFFRLSWLFLALSVVIPAVLICTMALLSDVDIVSRARPRNPEISYLPALINVSGPVCLGLSIVFGFLSLGIRPAKRSSRTPTRQTPPRHPMED